MIRDPHLICAYCDTANRPAATRCESCGAGLRAAGTVAAPRSWPPRLWRPVSEWRLKTWVIVGIALVAFGPIALMFGFVFFALALGALFHQPAIMLPAMALTALYWIGRKQRAEKH